MECRCTEVVVYHADDSIMRDTLFYINDGKVFDKVKAVAAFADDQYKSVERFYLKENDDVLVLLENVYERTQNIHENWNKENPCRSTSVGDIIEVINNDETKHDFYIVASFGFDFLFSHKGKFAS